MTSLAILVISAVLIFPQSPSPPPADGNVALKAQAAASDVDLTAKTRRRGTSPVVPTSRPPAYNGAVPAARRLEPIPCYAPGSVLCARDAQVCEPSPTGEPVTLYWIFTGPPGVAEPTQEQWNLTDRRCLTPAQATAAGAGAAAVPVLTAQQFRRLPLPAGVVHVQPGNGRTLVNVPTNVYVVARPAVIPTTLVGFAVRVRATPVAYDWAFGDEQRLHTSDPGAAYPDLRTTHTYLAPGTVTLALTTTYRGQYSVAGGPWLPVDGTAAVASPPQTLVVVAARSELVADPLTT